MQFRAKYFTVWVASQIQSFSSSKNNDANAYTTPKITSEVKKKTLTLRIKFWLGHYINNIKRGPRTNHNQEDEEKPAFVHEQPFPHFTWF